MYRSELAGTFFSFFYFPLSFFLYLCFSDSILRFLTLLPSLSLSFFFFPFPWSVLPSQGILGTFLPRSSLHTSPLHLSPRILLLARLLLYLTERELKITVLFIYHVNPVIKELLCALYPAYACANTSLFCRVPFHLSFFSSDLMEWYVCLGRVLCFLFNFGGNGNGRTAYRSRINILSCLKSFKDSDMYVRTYFSRFIYIYIFFFLPRSVIEK